MAPKRATRSNTAPETTNTTSVTNAQLQAMINQGITAALAARDADKNTNGDDSHNLGTGVRRTERTACECTYTDFLKCQPLNFKGTEGVVGLSQWFERMESVFHISNCTIENQVKCATCTLYSVALTWWNTHVKTVGHDDANGMPWKTLMKMMTDKHCPQNEIKKLETEIWDLKWHLKPKTMQDAVEIEIKLMDKKIRTFIEHQTESKRKFEEGHWVGHKPTCYKCEVQGNFKRECPKLKNNNNRGNQVGGGNAPAKVYAEFVSTTFSPQIDITPTALDHYYDVELADGRIIGLNTILRGCTLNILNHPFTIDLMPVELGSFDAIIGMDWLVKYQAITVYAKKIVRIPWGNETLIVHGDGSNWGNEACLHIISYTKTQEYMLKGCLVFLANVTTKETEDKSEKKRLEDVPIIRNFPDVFPEDFPGLPQTQQVEFQIDLIPGAAAVARAPYRLAHSEMKEFSEQMKELFDKGFIRPSSSPWGAPVLFVKKKDGSF
ncbi:putative reverse transcriptase domain-containing protein [Tanacetum coccineum]